MQNRHITVSLVNKRLEVQLPLAAARLAPDDEAEITLQIGAWRGEVIRHRAAQVVPSSLSRRAAHDLAEPQALIRHSDAVMGRLPMVGKQGRRPGS